MAHDLARMAMSARSSADRRLYAPAQILDSLNQECRSNHLFSQCKKKRYWAYYNPPPHQKKIY